MSWELHPDAAGLTSAWCVLGWLPDVRAVNRRPVVARVVPNPNLNECEPNSEKEIGDTVNLVSA